MTGTRFLDNQQKCDILKNLDNYLLIDTVLEAVPIGQLHTKIHDIANDMKDDMKKIRSLRRGLGAQREQLLVLASKLLTAEQIQHGLNKEMRNSMDARNQLEAALKELKP